MRIEAYTQVQQLYNTNKVNKTAKTASVGRTDQVQISSFGRDIQTAKQALANTPDVREDKVEPIRQAIQNDSYDVDTDSFLNVLLNKANN